MTILRIVRLWGIDKSLGYREILPDQCISPDFEAKVYHVRYRHKNANYIYIENHWTEAHYHYGRLYAHTLVTKSAYINKYTVYSVHLIRLTKRLRWIKTCNVTCSRDLFNPVHKCRANSRYEIASLTIDREAGSVMVTRIFACDSIRESPHARGHSRKVHVVVEELTPLHCHVGEFGIGRRSLLPWHQNFQRYAPSTRQGSTAIPVINEEYLTVFNTIYTTRALESVSEIYVKFKWSSAWANPWSKRAPEAKLEQRK